MSQQSILEVLSHIGDDQLATRFGESYSQLILHFESSPEQRSKSLRIFERYLKLDGTSNSQSLLQLARICSDLKRLFVENLSKIDNLVAHPEEAVCDQYCSMVTENCSILSCIRDVLGKVGPCRSAATLEPIVSDVMSTLSATFKHCNDRSHSYACAAPIFSQNINNLFKLCNELLFQCLELVNTLEADEDADQLNRILELAFDLGTLLSNLELKTMAQLWKSVTSLLQKHSSALRDRFDVRRAIRYFCVEIERKIDAVYELVAKNRAVSLKVLNFFLKVALKLCECFSGCLRPCLPDLCSLISVLYRNSSICAKYEGRCSEIAVEIETSLLPAVDPLISSLMKEDGFVEHFLQLKTENVSALLLLSVILQKFVLSSPEYLEYKLFEAVFQNICSCSSELHFDVRIAVVPSTSLQLPQEVYLYDALVVHVSSLVISAVSEQHFHLIEKLLVTHLLRSPTAMKVFICDLWCVLVRYGSCELCFEHAKLLWSTLPRLHCEKLETVFVRSLLKRFFNFLSRAQQQKFVNYVANDSSTLLEVVSPEVRSTSAILEELVVTKAAERAQELSLATGLSSQDVDLLLDIRVACQMNESVALELQIREYVLSVWSQVQSIQPEDCGLLLGCAQHLVMVSISCSLPHSAILPVIERLLCSQCLFLKLLILHYLQYLSARKADDLQVDKFSSSVSSLFRALLKDETVLVRERAVEKFSYFSHLTVYEQIIHTTIANEPELTKRVMNFVQKKIYPGGCEKSCDHFLKNLRTNRRAKVVAHRPTNVVEAIRSPQPKKIKLDFDFDGEILEIDSRLRSLLCNLNVCELSSTQKNTLKRVVEAAGELRKHL